jgi:hypothetical protein
VNGETVRETLVRTGDEIRAGTSAFVVLACEREQQAPPAPGFADFGDFGTLELPGYFSGKPASPPPTPPSPADSALRRLRAVTGPLYAVLDAARDPRVLAYLRNTESAVYSLYEGAKAQQLANFAPYIVDMHDERSPLEGVVREGWGHSWGVFCASPEEIPAVRKHFRRFLLVKDEGGKEMYFRFYDPRVLREFLRASSPAEKAAFFGPVTTYLLEGRDGGVLEFPAESAAPKGPPQPGGEFVMTRAHMSAFSACMVQEFENRMVAHLRAAYPLESGILSEADLRNSIRNGLAKAQRYGIDSETDVRRYLECMMLWGRDFDTDGQRPWAARILGAASLAGREKMDAIVLTSRVETEKR